MNKNKIQTTLSIVIGLLFIFSGSIKLMDVSSFINHINDYGIFAYIAPIAIFIPPLEILLGLALFFPLLRKITSLIIMVTLTIFTIVFYYGHFFGTVDSCQCFGKILTFGNSANWLFLRNIIFFVLVFWLYKISHYASIKISAWQIVLFFTGILVSMISVASSFEPFIDTSVIKKNTPVIETPLNSLITVDKDTTYLLFFYNMNCPDCWNAIENVKAYNRLNIVDKVLGFAIGKEESLKKFEAAFEVNFPTKLISTETIVKTAEYLPVAYFIENNKVIGVQKIHIIAPLLYKKTR